MELQKKIKNYLQIGNQLYTNYNSKSENRIGYFKIEIQKAYSPIYFEDPKKLNCINSAMHLIKLLTADAQANIKVFDLINQFYKFISDANWLKEYIIWELELLKVLGYDLKLESIVNKELKNDEILYFAISSKEKKIVPNFLINKNKKENDLKILLQGLKLVGNFMDKTILKPNNLNLPLSRINFENSLK